MDHKCLLQVFWICALLFNGCLTALKEHRYRSQSQTTNIGDDKHDERFISPGSEAEDGDQKPAVRHTPTRGSSRQNVQQRPGSQTVELNRVAHGPAADKALHFPLGGPANSPLGAANQQAAATGFKNVKPQASSGFPVYADQSGGHSQLVSDSQAPEAKVLVYEDVFHVRDSGPAQHYRPGKGYDDGRSAQHFGSQGSMFDTRMPFYQKYGAQPVGHAGVGYGNLAPTSYNDGSHSNPEETVQQGTNGLVFLPPPPPYKPVYFTQSRHAYSRARYTHFRSKYSPDLDVPEMSVDPQPPQDVPVMRKDTKRAQW